MEQEPKMPQAGNTKKQETLAEKQRVEQELQSLVGKKIEGFAINDFGAITIRFEGGLELNFQANGNYEFEEPVVDFETVKVEQK